MQLRAIMAFMLSSAFVSVAFVTVAAGQDVQAAAAAYARAQQAQLGGHHADAAALFELADQAAPSPQALRSAIRNHRAAGQLARAATLSLAALRRYAEEPETTTLAHEVLGTARETLGRMQVRCEPACSLAVDGRAAAPEALTTYDGFHEPGERTISATWPDRPSVSRGVALAIGEITEVSLEAPALPEPAVEEPEPRVEEPEPEPPLTPEPMAVDDDDDGLHPAFFLTALGVTALGGALITWSGLDVLDASNAYVADPTRERYDDGLARELRTNVLLIGTAAFGITAVLLAIFTEWGGDDDEPSLSVSVGPSGGFAALRARFDGVSP